MDDQMAQARAARAYIDSRPPLAQPDLELEAFMAIFHPEHAWHDLPPSERHERR